MTERTNLELMQEMTAIGQDLLHRELTTEETTALLETSELLKRLCVYHAARTIAREIEEAGIESHRVRSG